MNACHARLQVLAAPSNTGRALQLTPGTEESRLTSVKTTIELADEVFTRAKEQASREGMDVNQFLAAVVAKQLNADIGAPRSSPSARSRSKLPTIKGKGSGTIADATPELQAQTEEEDDLASHRRSFGR